MPRSASLTNAAHSIVGIQIPGRTGACAACSTVSTASNVCAIGCDTTLCAGPELTGVDVCTMQETGAVALARSEAHAKDMRSTNTEATRWCETVLSHSTWPNASVTVCSSHQFIACSAIAAYPCIPLPRQSRTFQAVCSCRCVRWCCCQKEEADQYRLHCRLLAQGTGRRHMHQCLQTVTRLQYNRLGQHVWQQCNVYKVKVCSARLQHARNSVLSLQGQ